MNASRDRGGATERPRVHWVSPLPPAETDIAHYTARILPELAEATDLTLWTDAPRWDWRLERHAPVRMLCPGRALPRDFAGETRADGRAEAIFIHIGNSWVFHAGLLRLAMRVPSIVVLHDLAIQDLCLGAVANGILPPDDYLSAMSRWYGQAGAEFGPRLLDGRMMPNDLAAVAPGFEIVLDRAAGVLTHTPLAFERVAARRAMPAWRLELPFRATPGPPGRLPAHGPLRLVQFGHIWPNRRLLEVLDVLGALKDEIGFRFDIMGRVWDEQAVAARAAALGIAERVRVHGFVSEGELDRRLAEADLVFNLRWPTMGEASGSQLRIWNAGAPSVVTDAGWYSELDDSTVFKTRIESEAGDLTALLRRLAADRSLGAERGAAGRALLETRHAPRGYARAIAEIARQSPAALHDATLARAVAPIGQAVVSGSAAADLYARAFAAGMEG